MASVRSVWTRKQLLVAFALYCRLPFGRLHHRNPEIIQVAAAIGRTPSALAMKLSNIASLDPALTSTGRKGLTGASANDRAMWDEMHSGWEKFAATSAKALAELAPEADNIPNIDDWDNRVGEERMAQRKIRVGQAFFRSAVLSAYNERCCISGLSPPALLVASHIVPWRVDKLNRTNPHNGLLLSALHDKAFDAGLITINDDLTVRVSDKHAPVDDVFFARAIASYEGQQIAAPEKFGPDLNFLAYHRENIFQA